MDEANSPTIAEVSFFYHMELARNRPNGILIQKMKKRKTAKK